MQIIQNLACVEILVNENDNKISFRKDILEGKKVNSIFLFGSTQDEVILSPFTSELLSQTDELDDLNLYLNIFDKSSKHVLKDFYLDNFSVDTESFDRLTYEINRVIDVENMYLISKSLSITDVRLLMYIIYQTENTKPSPNDITGSITIDYLPTSEIENIKLIDLIGYNLNGKAIKEIKLGSSNLTHCYLDLKSKDGKRYIENMPANLFGINPPGNFTIDPMFIDSENSYLRVRAFAIRESIQITFIY